MSTTSPTHSRLLEKRNAVPLLLSSFPAPPTFIPTSPLLAPLPHPNPPPSLPPSSPLPPLPGPSPITEHETLRFISAARSRRASKLSLNSSSRRESTATISSIISGSNCSVPPLSPSASLTPLDSSNRSIRSFSSTSSLPPNARISEKHSRKEPRIREEDPSELTELTLEDFSRHSPLPDVDLTDDEKVLELGILPGSLKRIRSPTSPRDNPPNPPRSPDLSPSVGDGNDGDVIVTPSYAIQAPSPLNRSFSKSKLNKALPPLPKEPSSSLFKQVSTSSRPDSPDIQSILASTPRPRRTSSSSLHASSRPRSTSRTLRRASTRTGLKPRRSNGPPSMLPLNLSASALESRKLGAHSWSAGDPSTSKGPSDLPYIRSASGPQEEGYYISGYGDSLDGSGTVLDVTDNEDVDRLERELDGEDSDSSIDLHTPLPHVMLRDGLLSPHSKLLPGSSRAPSPVNARPGSLLSVASTVATVMTKSGIYKDQRDTHRRRTRHRDGRLLQGGIGLTTGLGWSDSEDEDAPSPLTRRLSSLVLARKQSEGSLYSQSVSRSVSASASTSASIDRQTERPRARSSLPPTSWSRRTEMRTSTSSTSTTSSVIGRSARTSGHSDGSPALSNWRSSDRAANRSSSTHHAVDQVDVLQETYSSSSTSSGSLLLPITPVGSEDSIRDPHPGYHESKASAGVSRLHRMPSFVTEISLPSRSRTQSGSSASSLGSHTPRKTPTLSTRTPVPRPLRLPQVSGRTPILGTPFPQMPGSSSNLSNAGSGSRTRTTSTSKVPPATPSASRLARPTTSSLPSRPATVVPPSPSLSTSISRPKPRTGTGMQYRTGAPARPTLLRPPSSNLLRATAATRSMSRDIGVKT